MNILVEIESDLRYLTFYGVNTLKDLSDIYSGKVQLNQDVVGKANLAEILHESSEKLFFMKNHDITFNGTRLESLRLR